MSTPNEPSAEDMRGALVIPGFELPDNVTLGRGVVLSDGLQPEDVGVLAWLKLRDPRLPATQEDLAKEMQAAGWKMGKTRFASIFQRLKATGHIKHTPEYNPETGRPEWRIEFFLNPANNDHYVNSGISAFPQVGAETLETGDSQTEQLFETPETGVSRGQKESLVSRDSEGNPGNQGFGTRDVSAGRSRNPGNPVFGSPPPHPPEVVVTTSPYPLTDGAQQPSQTEGEEGQRFAQEELEAAADLLQRLGGHWRVGKPQAVTLAPSLLAIMSNQGWPPIGEVDRQLLTAELTADAPPVIRSAARLLSKERIPNLRLYSEATRATERPQGTPTPPRTLPERPDPSQLSKRPVTAILDSLVKDI